MAGLADIPLKTSYHRGEDDIAQEFYLPCMAQSARYRRAVGFFRSSVFIIAWPELRGFVQRGGRMEILCSNVLSSQDVEALQAGYRDRVIEGLGGRLTIEVQALLDDAVLREPARILAALVAAGTIEFRIALVPSADGHGSAHRMFHDKVGVFYDDFDNRVLFKGSMNETWYGLSGDGNIESVDVAASWMGNRDVERIDREEGYLSTLWANRYDGVETLPFPAVAQERLSQASDADWEETLERSLLDDRTRNSDALPPRTLRPHQSAGLASWTANDRRGVLAFATGSGKTFTALTAMREALARGEVPIVVVPDRTLFSQWQREISSGLADANPVLLRVGAGHSGWRDSLTLWTSPGGSQRLVLATLRTASGQDFLSRLVGGEHLMLVVDEVHNAGAPQSSRLLRDASFGPRLGLSATPERAGDPEGTARILDFFSGVLEPRYNLNDAIRDGVLCRYFYHPHSVVLSRTEMADWREISERVGRLYAQIQNGDSTPQLRDRWRMLLIERARIVKKASGKIALARRVIQDHFEDGQQWIVYCDDLDQLQLVTASIADLGLNPLPYHSAMSGDRVATLRWLERQGGIVTSIRCLDEGVDIPSVTHALILASSRNPREFIQRRGRVLRTSTATGKFTAHIHDAIVIPRRNEHSDDLSPPDPITAGEVARALEFAENAENPSAGTRLRLAALDAGVDWNGLETAGVEDDDDDQP